MVGFCFSEVPRGVPFTEAGGGTGVARDWEEERRGVLFNGQSLPVLQDKRLSDGRIVMAVKT